MPNRLRAAGLALVLALGVGAVDAPPALAQQVRLPAFRRPSPARFVISGTVRDGDAVLMLTGNGAQSGDRWQMELLGTPASGEGALQRAVLIGSQYYFSSGANPQWQVEDLNQSGGGTPHVRTNPPRGVNFLDPFSQAYMLTVISQTQVVERQTVNGVATTLYKSALDTSKLVEVTGGGTDRATNRAPGLEQSVTYAVGDADNVLRQLRIERHHSRGGPGGTVVQVFEDILITYQNIGQPVTIAAPAGATPFTPNVLAGARVGPSIAGAVALGLRLPATGAAAMARATDGNQAIGWLLVGAGGLLAGFLVRRRAVRSALAPTAPAAAGQRTSRPERGRRSHVMRWRQPSGKCWTDTRGNWLWRYAARARIPHSSAMAHAARELASTERAPSEYHANHKEVRWRTLRPSDYPPYRTLWRRTGRTYARSWRSTEGAWPTSSSRRGGRRWPSPTAPWKRSGSS
jgi:hypothetical protein